MIKKQLIPCSGAFFLFLIMSVMLRITSQTRVDSFALKVNLPSMEKQEVVLNTVQVQQPEKVKKGYNFANESLPKGNEKVSRKLGYFLEKNTFKNVQSNQLHAKAKRWFPVIEPILKKYGIPEDFKYVPLVESGFVYGTSSKGASGFWQFMPGTARTYGLRVGSGIDDRHDLEKSTIAACRYIKDLYGIFKNWTLVAAAYNLGENGILNYIRNHGHKNYYAMKLNRETASYVYKLISMKEIIERPAQYGYRTDIKPEKKETPNKRFAATHRVMMTRQNELDAVNALSLLQPQHNNL